jgi:hypothetical protein
MQNSSRGSSIPYCRNGLEGRDPGTNFPRERKSGRQLHWLRGAAPCSLGILLLPDSLGH